MKQKSTSAVLTWNVSGYAPDTDDPCRIACHTSYNGQELQPLYSRSMRCGSRTPNPLRVRAQVDAQNPQTAGGAVTMADALNMSAYCDPYKDFKKHTGFHINEGQRPSTRLLN